MIVLLLMRYLVITPEYDEVMPVLDDGSGPVETGRDVIEIDAETSRDAIALGVQEMLRSSRQDDYSVYSWCRWARLDGCSPYAGVVAELLESVDD